jgi:hypothetical protein
MIANATAVIVAFIFAAIFLLLALVSTVSKVTLVLFNPWLLRQLRYCDQPRTFTAVVFVYWLLGAVGLAAGIAALTGALRL